jgi:hypothetical protein
MLLPAGIAAFVAARSPRYGEEGLTERTDALPAA